MLKCSHFAVQKDGIMYHARTRHMNQFEKTPERVLSASKYQRVVAADMKI